MSDSRLGEIRYNTFGTPMKIIEYRSHGDITVEFLDQYRIQKNTTYSNFKIGQVRNPYDRNVKNVGYMGEGKYTSDGSQYIRRVFGVWVGMLERCYSEDMRHKYPVYEQWLMEGIQQDIMENILEILTHLKKLQSHMTRQKRNILLRLQMNIGIKYQIKHIRH